MPDRSPDETDRGFLAGPADLEKLRRFADWWRAIGRNQDISEIDRAIAEIERLRAQTEVDRAPSDPS